MALTYIDFLKRRLGGSSDASGLLAIIVSALSSNPALRPLLSDSVHPMLLSATLGIGGGAMLGNRLLDPDAANLLNSPLRINSSESPLRAHFGVGDDRGLIAGYRVDNGDPVLLDYEHLMRHVFIGGQSGVGKTVLGSWLLGQHIKNGGGLLMVDGKLDQDTIDSLYMACLWAGRPHDFLIINPGNPEMSNSYNPVLSGEPDEVSFRCLSLIPSTESDAGADYFKQAANQGIATLVSALQRAGLAYNFIDLTILLMSQAALNYLEGMVPPSPEKTSLSLFLEQFRTKSNQGGVNIDMKRLKEVFGGIAGRLYMFGTGDFGKVMNTYDPEVNLRDAILANKVVYVALPTMGKDVAASNFGKMVVGDYRTAVAEIQSLPKHQRPWPPFFCFFDEAGSYMTASFNRVFEQARSAHQILCPAVQTLANFEAISPELKEMVVGNTWNKFFFKVGTQATAEEFAELIGMEQRITRSLSVTGNQGSNSTPTSAGETGSSQGAALGVGEREQEDYKISPDDLKSLGKGECVMTYGGNKIFHLSVPMLQTPRALMEQVGGLRINHRSSRWAKGINLFPNADKFITSKD